MKLSAVVLSPFFLVISGFRVETEEYLKANVPKPLDEQLAAKYKIFTYWDYPADPGPFVDLNLQTWLAHSPQGTEIVKVNGSNIRDIVPDCPEEFFRLPYAAAMSDFVRASVLYHHGGLYMDTDFLVMSDLGRVWQKLDDGWDIVAYSAKDDHAESGDCNTSLTDKSGVSSNFLAGKKHNPFHRTWWENLKAKLTRICGEGEFQMKKLCCHEAFAPVPENRLCHVPWAHIEVLKLPQFEPDKEPLERDGAQGDAGHVSSVTVDATQRTQVLQLVKEGNRPATPLPPDVKMYCLKGDEGVAPHLNGEIFWQPWTASSKSTNLSVHDSRGYDVRFDCQETGLTMDCKEGNWGKDRRVFPNFFGRIAYHLFSSTFTPWSHEPDLKPTNRSAVKHRSWLLTEMYSRSLGPEVFGQ